MTMTDFDQISTRIFAGIGAIAMSLVLFVGSFATPEATTTISTVL